MPLPSCGLPPFGSSDAGQGIGARNRAAVSYSHQKTSCWNGGMKRGGWCLSLTPLLECIMDKHHKALLDNAWFKNNRLVKCRTKFSLKHLGNRSVCELENYQLTSGSQFKNNAIPLLFEKEAKGYRQT